MHLLLPPKPLAIKSHLLTRLSEPDCVRCKKIVSANHTMDLDATRYYTIYMHCVVAQHRQVKLTPGLASQSLQGARYEHNSAVSLTYVFVL